MLSDIERIIENAGFTENDWDTGTNGLCGAFALAMTEVFPGIEVVLVCDSTENGEPVIDRDGGPMWRHVVVRQDGQLFDITGRVLPEHAFENFCWTSRHGGCLHPIDYDELLALLTEDNKSYDRPYTDKWKAALLESIATMSPEENAALI